MSSRGKRIGDYAAGTYVVRDRVSLSLQPPIPMPPMLALWAASADVRTPPVGLSLAIRQYLGRLHALDPMARQRMGELLADRLSAYVAPPPPPARSPGTSWPPSAPPSASETWLGCTGTRRSGPGSSRDDAESGAGR